MGMNLKQTIKKFIFEHKKIDNFYNVLKRLVSNNNKGTKIINRGGVRLKKDFSGINNYVEIGSGSKLIDSVIIIHGNNNSLIFNENCIVGADCSFRLEGNDIKVNVGAGTTFTHAVTINAQESGTSIFIGKDCMFSNNIIVRTSDSHPIYDLEYGTRLNPPASVVIGDHVWISPNTKIMKGSIIESGAIIGSDTTVSGKAIKANSLAVGRPAKIVKENIKWTREKLF